MGRMTTLPLITVHDAERAVRRAERAERTHLTRWCPHPDVRCERCVRLSELVVVAYERLEAVRSQQPCRWVGGDPEWGPVHAGAVDD